MKTEHPFTTYVRTKLVFQQRLKDLKSYDTVRIYLYELKKLGVSGFTLWKLRNEGEIWYDEHGNFKHTIEGEIDPALMRITKNAKIRAPITKLHKIMRDYLMRVTVTSTDSLSVYFREFLKHRDKHLQEFFTVDGFSGRVHTPVVSLKSVFRPRLRLDESKLVSLDVKQMQPTVLAKILQKEIGDNPFSSTVWKGDDVYLLIQKQNKEIASRDDAKRFLYRLIFGKPIDDIKNMFGGDNQWVDWINKYKSRRERRNPHSISPHTNLAWRLQSEEVGCMKQIWTKLVARNIPFLTIHDDILCKREDEEEVLRVMDSILKTHFRYYEIVKKYLPDDNGPAGSD